MINFSLQPYTSLNNILAGQERSEVRKVIGGDYEEFYKTPISNVPTDDFIGCNIHVFYTDEFLCKGVEVFRPNDVFVAGISLLGTPFFDLKKEMEAKGYLTVISDSGFDCEKFGIAVYCPDFEDEPNAPVESIYISLFE